MIKTISRWNTLDNLLAKNNDNSKQSSSKKFIKIWSRTLKRPIKKVSMNSSAEIHTKYHQGPHFVIVHGLVSCNPNKAFSKIHIHLDHSRNFQKIYCLRFSLTVNNLLWISKIKSAEILLWNSFKILFAMHDLYLVISQEFF